MAADRVRTVGVSSKRLIPECGTSLSAIQDAVQRTRTGPPFSPPTLLDLHVRGAGLDEVFRSNWLLSAYHEVTHGPVSPATVTSLRATRETWMSEFEPVDRAGLTQIFMYEWRNVAAVAQRTTRGCTFAAGSSVAPPLQSAYNEQ